MQQLTVNLLTELGLKPLDNLEAVRRQGNAYALNGEGKLVAVSMTKTDLEQLRIAEECTELEHLYLAYNEKLSEIKFEVKLPKLEQLYVNNCALSGILRIPPGCHTLKQIYLQKNRLEILDFAGDCEALELLDASENALSVLGMVDGFLKLKYVYLLNNQITDLPESFVGMRHLEIVLLSGNPLWNIPQDVIGSGDTHNSAKELLAYLDSIQDRKTEFLHEAKMILVGNPMVGKSSIRIKLKDRDAPLPGKEDRTPALDVEAYTLKNLPTVLTGLDQPIDFQLNIWDFGGQGRYREIQQLFCSRKSLYLYVTSFDDKPEKEDYINLDYWLSMVNAYSFDQIENRVSPVIYVLNKIDKTDPGIDETTAKKKYPNLAHFIKISCETYKGIGQLIEQLQETLPLVSRDIFSNSYSTRWFRVKRRLENIKAHHISYLNYLEICSEEGLDLNQSQTWLTVLDRIGSVIYTGNFQDEQEWVILNPYWVKDAITKVIDSPYLHKDGILKKEYFDAIWKDYPDGEDRVNLVKLMLNEKYRLAFEVQSSEGDIEYMVPSALFNKPKPSFAKYPYLEARPDLSYEFRFSPFIPAGLVNKLVVALNEQTERTFIWKNACVLRDIQTNSYVHVAEDWQENKLMMKFFKDEPEVFFQKLASVLETFVTEIKNSKFLTLLEYEVWIDYKGRMRNLSELEELGISLVYNKTREPFGEHKKNAVMIGIEKELEGLSKALDLLIEKKNQFEEDLAITSDSAKKFNLKKELEKLEKDIQDYRLKIKNLSIDEQHVGEGHQITNKIDSLIQKTDSLSNQVGVITKQIEQGFQSVLAQLSAQDQQLLAILQISEATRSEVAQCFLELDQKPTDPYEMEIMIGRINSLIAEQIADLPEAITQRWKALNAKSPEYTDVKGKLKLKIPIIPAILEYETEASWDFRSIAKQIWADLKAGKVFLK